jgi:hypothetical protein
VSAADAKVLERYHRKKTFARNSERSKILNHNGLNDRALEKDDFDGPRGFLKKTVISRKP